MFFSRNISVFTIFNDQSFNDTLINDIFSFEQMGPGIIYRLLCHETEITEKDHFIRTTMS